MFYKYKIQEFTGEVYFYDDKKSIFELIDWFGVYRFYSLFTNHFVVGEGNIHHSEKKVQSGGYFCEESNSFHKYFDYVTIKRSGNFIIRDVFGKVVDISELVSDYRKSRGIDNKEKNKPIYNRWAKKRERPQVFKIRKGLKKEYQQNLFDIEEGYIKVRKKRHQYLKPDFYPEGHEINGSPKSWKDQKKLKQWS